MIIDDRVRAAFTPTSTLRASIDPGKSDPRRHRPGHGRGDRGVGRSGPRVRTAPGRAPRTRDVPQGSSAVARRSTLDSPRMSCNDRVASHEGGRWS
jgi:hypothetical protein